MILQYRKRIIWLPHNIDFRGRVYPVPPHLTHLGSDKARALLRFAKGEKLGAHGLDWLKVRIPRLSSCPRSGIRQFADRYFIAELPVTNIFLRNLYCRTGWQTVKKAIHNLFRNPEDRLLRRLDRLSGSPNGLSRNENWLFRWHDRLFRH